MQQIQASRTRISLPFVGDGSVVTWGGRCLKVEIVTCCAASAEECAADPSLLEGTFAAILADGSVVTWGDAAHWWRQ